MRLRQPIYEGIHHDLALRLADVVGTRLNPDGGRLAKLLLQVLLKPCAQGAGGESKLLLAALIARFLRFLREWLLEEQRLSNGCGSELRNRWRVFSRWKGAWSCLDACSGLPVQIPTVCKLLLLLLQPVNARSKVVGDLQLLDWKNSAAQQVVACT